MKRRGLVGLFLLALAAVGLLGARVTPSWQFPPGPILFRDGTAGAPSVSAAGDPDTGWYWPAANQLSATTGGVERVRLHSGGLMAAADNTYDAGTLSGSRFRDLFLARDLHVQGFVHVQGALAYGAHTVVIASNGVGGSANGETLNGLRSLYLLDCLDGDGCTVTLGETGVAPGSLVRLVNISTSGSANHNLTLSDAAPLHLAGALTLTADDAVTLLFVRNRSGDTNWLELGRSAN